MATTTTSTKLQYKFVDDDSNNLTFTYNYADPNVTTTNVNALKNAIINNGSIFQKVPTTAKSAKIITTSSTDVTLS